MHHSAWDLRRISTDRQSDLLHLLTDYRHLAVPALEARERHSAVLAHQGAQGDGSRPRLLWLGKLRCWFGAWHGCRSEVARST